MKKVEFANLKEGQLLQVLSEDHIQLYVDGRFEDNKIKNLVHELQPGQIFMYLKQEWVKNVECTLYFLLGDKIYTKRFVGGNKEIVNRSINDFLDRTYRPI